MPGLCEGSRARNKCPPPTPSPSLAFVVPRMMEDRALADQLRSIAWANSFNPYTMAAPGTDPALGRSGPFSGEQLAQAATRQQRKRQQQRQALRRVHRESARALAAIAELEEAAAGKPLEAAGSYGSASGTGPLPYAVTSVTSTDWQHQQPGGEASADGATAAGPAAGAGDGYLIAHRAAWGPAGPVGPAPEGYGAPAWPSPTDPHGPTAPMMHVVRPMQLQPKPTVAATASARDVLPKRPKGGAPWGVASAASSRRVLTALSPREREKMIQELVALHPNAANRLADHHIASMSGSERSSRNGGGKVEKEGGAGGDVGGGEGAGLGGEGSQDLFGEWEVKGPHGEHEGPRVDGNGEEGSGQPAGEAAERARPQSGPARVQEAQAGAGGPKSDTEGASAGPPKVPRYLRSTRSAAARQVRIRGGEEAGRDGGDGDGSGGGSGPTGGWFLTEAEVDGGDGASQGNSGPQSSRHQEQQQEQLHSESSQAATVSCNASDTHPQDQQLRAAPAGSSAGIAGGGKAPHGHEPGANPHQHLHGSDRRDQEPAHDQQHHQQLMHHGTGMSVGGAASASGGDGSQRPRQPRQQLTAGKLQVALARRAQLRAALAARGELLELDEMDLEELEEEADLVDQLVEASIRVYGRALAARHAHRGADGTVVVPGEGVAMPGKGRVLGWAAPGPHELGRGDAMLLNPTDPWVRPVGLSGEGPGPGGGGSPAARGGAAAQLQPLSVAGAPAPVAGSGTVAANHLSNHRAVVPPLPRPLAAVVAASNPEADQHLPSPSGQARPLALPPSAPLAPTLIPRPTPPGQEGTVRFPAPLAAANPLRASAPAGLLPHSPSTPARSLNTGAPPLPGRAELMPLVGARLPSPQSTGPTRLQPDLVALLRNSADSGLLNAVSSALSVGVAERGELPAGFRPWSASSGGSSPALPSTPRTHGSLAAAAAGAAAAAAGLGTPTSSGRAVLEPLPHAPRPRDVSPGGAGKAAGAVGTGTGRSAGVAGKTGAGSGGGTPVPWARLHSPQTGLSGLVGIGTTPAAVAAAAAAGPLTGLSGTAQVKVAGRATPEAMLPGHGGSGVGGGDGGGQIGGKGRLRVRIGGEGAGNGSR